jgi:hypothetical protein
LKFRWTSFRSFPTLAEKDPHILYLQDQLQRHGSAAAAEEAEMLADPDLLGLGWLSIAVIMVGTDGK